MIIRRAAASAGGTRVACWAAALLLALCAACGPGSGGSGKEPGDPSDGALDDLPAIAGDDATDFISDAASGLGGDGSRALGAGFANDSAGGLAGAAPSAERAISEADIIQLHGDTLYALSRYAGLTVIDVADPGDLRVLGNYRTAATPFEMYLDGGIAYVMFNGYYSYAYDEEAMASVWRSTSRVQALDVSDPATIEVIGDIEVPGDVSDSRRVGDILYLATYQDGWCWGCDEMPSTRVTAFDVGDPTRFEKVDELRFDDDGGWGPRSITVTTERMYVAGPNWNWDADAPRSTIQVVDIADPDGALGLGAEVGVAGQINSRWQMDELDGVLRVLSQRGNWRSTAPPVLETFTIESTETLSALGSLELVLPRPEDLQAVRFDGDRAYAITFERTDPLFTLDLTDPANPVQRGELEIPGWVYHMEPRGDRVYGLGFEDGNSDGGMHVSIFDVSDLDNPTMLDRVNFGGDWVNAAEDQDRIHKAFNLMLDEGLILVPFSGGEYDEVDCNYHYNSGIQIIDIDGDSLTERGVAPQLGSARRALMHRDHLFGVSDNAVQTFNISDRDAPTAVDRLEVARNIESLHLVGDRLLRFGSDWWTQRTLIDFTAPADANTAEPLGELDLSDIDELDDTRNTCNGDSYWGGQVLVHGETAYVPRYSYSYDGSSKEQLRVHVVDLSADAPRITGAFDVEPSGGDEHFTSMLITDSALLVGRSRGYYRYDSDGELEDSGPRFFYDIYDLAEPGAPELMSQFEVPEQMANQGWGYGPVGCGMDMGWGWWYGGDANGTLVRGDILVSQHAEPLDDDSGRVRYYMDRLDVGDPTAPRMLEPVNIPGQVLDYQPGSGRIVTIEDGLREVQASDADDCYWRGSRARFVQEGNGTSVTSGGTDSTEPAQGDCLVYERYLNALLVEGSQARRVSRVNVDESFNSESVAVSGSRVFVMLRERTRVDWDKPEPTEAAVDTFGVGTDGRLRRLPQVSLGEHQPGYWFGQLVARGAHAFLNQANEMLVIDSSDVAEPEAVRHDMPGYHCGSLEVDADRAYCAMGMQGVLSIDL